MMTSHYASLNCLLALVVPLMLGTWNAGAEERRLPLKLLQAIQSGKMVVHDLSHAVDENAPYWPEGSAKTPFQVSLEATFERDGYLARRLCMPEHFGTHMDAPAHFLPKGLPVDQIAVKELLGEAVVVDVSEAVKTDPNYRVTATDLQNWTKAHGPMPRGCIVLFRTGWDTRWPSEKDYMNQDSAGVMHFPGLSTEAARFLLENPHPAAIGIDSPSVDYGPSRGFEVHHLTHAAGLYHLENLTNLNKLPPRGALVIALPLKLRGGSGSPARVLALVEESSPANH
jgi:kynurenine formamidase